MDELLVSGYASVYNSADKHRDILLPGVFGNIDLANLKFLLQHDLNCSIGNICELQDQKTGLRMSAVIRCNTKHGKRAIDLVQHKLVRGLSVGFRIKKYNFDDNHHRIIYSAHLLEISLVSFPANSRAFIDKQRRVIRKTTLQKPNI